MSFVTSSYTCTNHILPWNSTAANMFTHLSLVSSNSHVLCGFECFPKHSKHSRIFEPDSRAPTTQWFTKNIVVPTLISNRLFCKLQHSTCVPWKNNAKLLLHIKLSQVRFFLLNIRFEIRNNKIHYKYVFNLRMSGTT